MKNISECSVTRSFKLYLNNTVIWEKESLTLSPNETRTFNRTTDASLGNVVSNSWTSGSYTMVLRGGIGSLNDITTSSSAIACQTSGCNSISVSVISDGGSSSNGCTDGTQYPSSVFTPTCTGSNETIETNCYAGEYSKVSVTNGISYTFSSSVSSDFITITNYGGTTVLATGTGSVSYAPTSATILRFYTHTDSNCGMQNTNRRRMVRCNSSANAPANDNCPNAINLTCGIVKTGTLTGATPTTNVSYLQGSKNDVFYYFTDTNSGDYTISLSDFSNDFDLFLYTDCNSAAALESSPTSSSTETITYSCTANTTYRIRVTDYESTSGNFNLLLTCPVIAVPSNDQCANYTTLSCGSVLNGTTVGATAKSVTDNTASSYGVWYSFLGDGQQTTISSSANYDHELVLLSGSCRSLTYIANNDDNNDYDSPNGYGSGKFN